MSSNVPATRERPQVAAGGQVAALIPQSLDEAFRVSQAIAASNLAPRGIDKPEQILVAIMAGAELGLAPFQSLQSFAVVNGRPTLWGDGLIAVVRARGVRVKEWIDGEGDQMVAHCVATRPDTGEEIARSFTVADAKKAGLWGKQGPWQQYPKRMLQMRARALALRDGCADMLRGIQVREEVEDYAPMRDVTPQRAGVMSRLPGGSNGEGFHAEVVEDAIGKGLDTVLDGDTIPDHDPKTGEVIDAEIEGPGEASTPSGPDAPEKSEPAAGRDPEPATATSDDGSAPDLAGSDFDPIEWAGAFNRNLANLDTVDEVAAAWDEAKAKGFVFKLKAKNPELAQQLAQAVNARVAEIKAAT